MKSYVEVEGLIAVVECKSHEGVPTLRVLDLDDEVAATIRDAFYRPIAHLAHREQLAISSLYHKKAGGGKGGIFKS